MQSPLIVETLDKPYDFPSRIHTGRERHVMDQVRLRFVEERFGHGVIMAYGGVTDGFSDAVPPQSSVERM
ncbi:hypothetical protein [Streptosporangium sp. NPDC051022]|uniref:hypothetical protein n=1 Tax=Streptosporangium sp. NPDC051022 TaxID=3155752 RepID=UPI0034347455